MAKIKKEQLEIIVKHQEELNSIINNIGIIRDDFTVPYDVSKNNLITYGNEFGLLIHNVNGCRTLWRSKFNKNQQNIIYPNSFLNTEGKRIPLQLLLMLQIFQMHRHDPRPCWCAKESDYLLVVRHEVWPPILQAPNIALGNHASPLLSMCLDMTLA